MHLHTCEATSEGYSNMSRTQEEITKRIRDVQEDDFLGFRTTVLLMQLDYEHARPWLKDRTNEQEWEENLRDYRSLPEQAATYLDFAWDKARNHRGISASRSVTKLTEWAWLMEREDVIADMEGAIYENYGVPKLFAFAKGFGLPIPEGDDLARMARGETCRPGCEEGCGKGPSIA